MYRHETGSDVPMWDSRSARPFWLGHDQTRDGSNKHRLNFVNFSACRIPRQSMLSVASTKFGSRILSSNKIFLRAGLSKFESQPLKRMDSVKALKDLGYGFNAEGQLRKLDEAGQLTSESFQFNISDDHHECQAHYEDLGAAVTPYVYNLLENKEQLIKLPVPKEDESKGTFIFASKDYDSQDVLLILIHGSGVVRAGQWARSLIINENLDVGSQLPYIRKGKANAWGIIVLNTNDNYSSDGKKIPNSSMAEEHAAYVWNTYVAGAKASKIVIVAHSYGGVVTMSLANRVKEDFEKRVKAVALTDSVHGYCDLKMPPFLTKVAKNWTTSSEPVDTALKTPENDIPRVSAGHTKHEMTSYMSMNSIFRFFDQKLHKKE